MPCFRCGARQSDPVRGASPWKRGVRADRQVLICPACQRSEDWTAALDRCVACGSTALICRLGEVECRACGHVRQACPPDRSGDLVTSGAPGLSEEVAAALSRVLGRGLLG
ncbi:hypothetical protein [Thermomonospora amylolytica]|uniref:hypothetical protein n=1 Tax=Thermomonospora amylolytica TaxID=1411117 RepID=UPI000E6C21FC|nr:hypothetical protein [Thermomonospora amylolytica]